MRVVVRILCMRMIRRLYVYTWQLYFVRFHISSHLLRLFFMIETTFFRLDCVERNCLYMCVMCFDYELWCLKSASSPFQVNSPVCSPYFPEVARDFSALLFPCPHFSIDTLIIWLHEVTQHNLSGQTYFLCQFSRSAFIVLLNVVVIPLFSHFLRIVFIQLFDWWWRW